MVQTWILLTLIAGLGSVGFNTQNRKTLKDGEDSTVYAWLFEISRATIFALLIYFDRFFIFSWANLGVLLALGMTELVGVYFYMKMHAYTELSVSSIISRFRVILIPLAAFIFLGERLTNTQYLGVLAIFVGCLVVAGNGKIRGTRGFWYALAFVFVSVISNILIKMSTAFASNSVVAMAFSLPSAILIPLIMKSTFVRFRISIPHILRPTIGATLLNVVTMYALVAAYRLAPVSLVNSMFQSITTLSVVVGIFFLQENDHKTLKLVGAALTTIGIITLI